MGLGSDRPLRRRVIVSDLTHFPLVAGVLLGGLDEVAAAVEVFVVLVQHHVSVLDQHVGQVRLWSDTGGIVNTSCLTEDRNLSPSGCGASEPPAEGADSGGDRVIVVFRHICMTMRRSLAQTPNTFPFLSHPPQTTTAHVLLFRLDRFHISTSEAQRVLEAFNSRPDVSSSPLSHRNTFSCQI